MSLSAQLRQQFLTASEDALAQPCFQEPPAMNLQALVLSQILEPITESLHDNPFFSGCELTLAQKVEEMRRMCVEAQTAHTTKDGCTKQRRTELLNLLQVLLEDVEESEVHSSEMIVADYKFLSLPDFADVIKESAQIHSEFLNNPNVSKALNDIAKKFEAAPKRLWEPEALPVATTQVFDTTLDAGNEDDYEHQEPSAA